MNFEQEYQLKEFRKVEPELFDENGKHYSGTSLSDREAEKMLKLINVLNSNSLSIGKTGEKFEKEFATKTDYNDQVQNYKSDGCACKAK